MSVSLEQARKYEAEASKEISLAERPSFHITPPVGWSNDPNGFSEYKNQYHLFYQYYPYDTEWGPMHWGHYKSEDFLKWTPLPCALAPDLAYDAGGCFSGSALEWEGKHYLFYTSVQDISPKKSLQTQSAACGDGVNYKKFSENPLITGKNIPEKASPYDFRDPKVWRAKGQFYAVAANRGEDGSGQILLFSSENLKDWRYETILAQSFNQYGKMWECPDFFSLDGHDLLLVSPQEMRAEGLDFHNGHNNIYILGRFDYETKRFERDYLAALDYGMDFYAAQTMQSSDNRRIMIVWMGNWHNHIYPDDAVWAGAMTVPRELSIQDGRLRQKPVRELENYYRNTIRLEDVSAAEFRSFEGIRGTVFDMTLRFSPENLRHLALKLAADDKYFTALTYDGEKEIFTTDRGRCGMRKDLLASRSMALEAKEDGVSIRILMDKYSIEVFCNEGEKVMTSLIAPPEAADKILFKSDGIFDLEFHELPQNINSYEYETE